MEIFEQVNKISLKQLKRSLFWNLLFKMKRLNAIKYDVLECGDRFIIEGLVGEYEIRKDLQGDLDIVVRKIIDKMALDKRMFASSMMG